MGVIATLARALFLRGGAEGLLREGAAAARVFRADATRALELGAEAYMAAHASHLAEFTHSRPGWFDSFVNGLNRLPRPLLALGTLGLFGYAMASPEGFSRRMQALAEVPEPMWWLLGAVVAFYFGAREAHHLRLYRASCARATRLQTAVDGRVAVPQPNGDHRPGSLSPQPDLPAEAGLRPAADPARDPIEAAFRDRNPALEAWRQHISAHDSR